MSSSLGEEFVIHPGEAGELADLEVSRGLKARPTESTYCSEAGEGDVVGGLANGGAFLTDAVLAVDDGRFEGREVESECETFGDGLELLLAGSEVLPIDLPVAVPIFALGQI
jgi:hypothetical protein